MLFLLVWNYCRLFHPSNIGSYHTENSHKIVIFVVIHASVLACKLVWDFDNFLHFASYLAAPAAKPIITEKKKNFWRDYFYLPHQFSSYSLSVVYQSRVQLCNLETSCTSGPIESRWGAFCMLIIDNPAKD